MELTEYIHTHICTSPVSEKNAVDESFKPLTKNFILSIVFVLFANAFPEYIEEIKNWSETKLDELIYLVKKRHPEFFDKIDSCEDIKNYVASNRTLAHIYSISKNLVVNQESILFLSSLFTSVIGKAEYKTMLNKIKNKNL